MPSVPCELGQGWLLLQDPAWLLSQVWCRLWVLHSVGGSHLLSRDLCCIDVGSWAWLAETSVSAQVQGPLQNALPPHPFFALISPKSFCQAGAFQPNLWMQESGCSAVFCCMVVLMPGRPK